MSRIATPVAAQPSTQTKVAHERIAMRAYEKWEARGCPHGTDQQDWLEAEAELKAEGTKTHGAAPARTATPPRPVTPAPQPAPSTARRR
jgi:hypothetical protein